MANLTETPIYEAGIFQLEKTTPPLGGAPAFNGSNPSAGHANVQALQLANRTSWLKQQLESGGSAAGLAESLLSEDDGKGSDQVRFVQDYSNAVGTTVRNKLRDIEVSLYDFGCDMTGATDSSAALQNALNCGATRIVGKGKLYLTTPNISWPRGVILEGNDQLEIDANIPAGSDLFIVTDPASGFKPLTGIRNTVVTSRTRGRYFFTTPSSANAWNRQSLFDFTGLKSYDFNKSLTIATNYWDRILNIGDCKALSLEKFQFVGGMPSSATSAAAYPSVGLYISSTSGAIGVYVRDGSFTSCTFPIVFGDGVEGYSVQDVELFSCWIGIDHTNTGLEPGGFIDNVHSQASYRGFRLSKRVEAQIGQVSAYRSSAFPDHGLGWAGIEFVECDFKINMYSINVVPGSSTAVANSSAVKLTRTAATGLYIGHVNSSLQLSYCFDVDSSSGLNVGGVFCRGANSFMRITNTSSNTSNIHIHEIDTSNPDSTLYNAAAGTDLTTITLLRKQGTLFTANQNIVVSSSNLNPTSQPKTPRTVISLSGTVAGNVIIPRLGATKGDKKYFQHVNQSAVGSSVSYCDDSTATVRKVINSGNSNRYILEFEFTGTSWLLNSVVADLSAATL